MLDLCALGRIGSDFAAAVAVRIDLASPRDCACLALLFGAAHSSPKRYY